jgi:ribose transport system substrate-binding protein
MSNKQIKIRDAVYRSGIAVVFLGLMGSVLAACSPSPPGNNTAANNSTRSGKLKSVAVTVGDLGNPFFVLMGRGAEAEAKKIGGDDVRVTVVSSGYDLNQQFNQIENFVAANTDVIILNAADSKGIEAIKSMPPLLLTMCRRGNWAVSTSPIVSRVRVKLSLLMDRQLFQ